MSILDNILGGGGDQESTSQNSNNNDAVFGTNPNFGTDLSDVLHFENASNDSDGSDGDSSSDSTSLTGIGDASVDFAAPTFLGISSSQENSQHQASDGDNGGGLLSGIA
jgi:hypothetical protein